jgi:SAM-dependent methyltransferase
MSATDLNYGAIEAGEPPGKYVGFKRMIVAVGLKQPALWAYRSVANLRLWRYVVTGGFRSGMLALGETNHYGFPARWITMDQHQSDLTGYFNEKCVIPFADASLEAVYSAHFIEHLTPAALSRLFSEIRRVLRPGGAVRLETVDAELLRRAYRCRDEQILTHFRNARKYLVDELRFPKKYLEDQLTFVGEVASYMLPGGPPVHIPVYATAQEVDRRLDMPLEEFSAWAQSLKSPEQIISGGHNCALSGARLKKLLLDAGFAEARESRYGETGIKKLSLNRGFWRSIWDSITEKPHRRSFSCYVEAFA